MTAAGNLTGEAALSPLRQDLRLSGGATSAEGERVWVVYDPFRHRYFQIGRRAFELLLNWEPMTPAQLNHKIINKGEIPFDESELIEMEIFLSQNDLIDRPAHAAAQHYARLKDTGKSSFTETLIKNYLFFRVPLVRPDGFLKSTFPLVSPLFTRAALFFAFLIGIVGLYLVSRQWTEFVTAFQYFFSLQGLFFFGLTLAFVKTIHELAHGYMAAKFGVRVPTMGIAFLLLFPMLFTDVSDAWRLKSQRQKLLINSAGILAELMLAACATFLWVFLQDGPLRSAAFFVATTSWVLSLLINLNPLMRFDGYFILADALNISNLQTRSFNLGKWLLREILFKLDVPCPENFSYQQATRLALFAWAVWIYRFFLFIGIALIIYHATFKILGLFLFAAEIYWLIAKPIGAELKVWWGLKEKILKSPRSLLPLIIILGIAALLFLPIDRQIQVPAIHAAENEVTIFPPFSARVTKILVSPGDRVEKGDVLFHLDHPEKKFLYKQSLLKVATLEDRLSRISSDQGDLLESQVLQSEKKTEEQRGIGLVEELEQLYVKAPIGGQVVELDKYLSPGLHASSEAKLAIIAANGNSVIRGLISEQALSRIKVGLEGKFFPDDAAQEATPVVIADIADVASKFIEEPSLASAYGGPLAVETTDKEKLRAVTGVYRVTFKVKDGVSVEQVTRGVVKVEAAPEMIATGIFRAILRVLLLESGS